MYEIEKIWSLVLDQRETWFQWVSAYNSVLFLKTHILGGKFIRYTYRGESFQPP